MSPNKQSRKQRTRGKNTTNQTRERTVLTLTEDPASVPPYMLPNQPAFAPALGNMFAQLQAQGQQQKQPAVSIPDMNNFQYQQQPNMMHPFSQLQSSTFFNHIQPFHNQSQGVPQQISGEAVSDLERLRQLKSTILAGQHPFFKPVPNPDALASIYLGPHPASQAYQQQNQQQQPTHSEHGPPVSLSQPQSESPAANASQKPDPAMQLDSTTGSNASKLPQTPAIPSGLAPSGAPESLPAQQVSASVPSSMNDQPAGTPDATRNDINNGNPHQSVIIPPKNIDYRSNTPSPSLPSSTKSSVNHTSQRGPLLAHSSGASGTHHEHGHLPSVAASPVPVGDGVGANKHGEVKDGSAAAYRETHIDAPPGSYERERDRDRERPGYPPYEPPRFPDRRDNGRFTPRFYDSRYNRDRDWDRSRDWEREKERDKEREREREKERGRDRDRRRVDDKLPEERRNEYERLSRPPLDRQPPPPQTGGTIEGKPSATADQPPVSAMGQSAEQRRSDISVHPEQRRSAVPSHPEQSRHSEPAVPRSAPPPTSADQRRPEASSSPFSFSEQPPHDRERFHLGLVSAPQPPPSQTSVGEPSQQQPPLRPEKRQAVSVSMDERSGLNSVSTDQHAPPGNTGTRPGVSSLESNRRSESVNLTARPPTGGAIPPPTNTSPTRTAPERRPVHTGDASPPARVNSRPIYSHQPPPPRTISPTSSHRVGEVSYEALRDREHDRAAPPSSHREPPSGIAAARGFAEDLRRPPIEASASRHTSDYYTQTPPAPTLPVMDRQNETRQWRERVSYPPASYPGSDVERDRARRYLDNRDWHGDPYGRERGADADAHPRTRPPPPPPPAFWERERPVDKDKERDRYETWNGDRKYPTPDAGAPPPQSVPPPPRWEDHAAHAHRPLHSRLSDSYDDRFIPRDIAERGRYPPPPPAAIPEDVPMRDSFRENPRVRPRSPSPGRPVGVFDDAHRAKRVREEYEPLTRPPYYEDARRPGPPASEYGARVAPPTPPYYDPRAPALSNPRDPSPYSRDRVPDPYPRREMPPPRSPPFYARERYPPR